MNRVASFLAVLALAGCATVTSTTDPFPPASRTADGIHELEVLSSYLTGTWESLAQGAPGGPVGDSSKVTMRVARVWEERRGEYWFYEEFERAGEAGRPYLQQLVRAGTVGEDVIFVEYTLPGEARRYVGAWANTRAAFGGTDPKTLREYPDCRQKATMQNIIVFAGGMIGKACRAGVPEGSYRIRDFSLSSSTLRLWDRGYDASGKIVWGSAAGPLELRRMSTEAR